MAVSFFEYFSGSPAAYELLYGNMKCGVVAGRELSDFLRERSALEETNSKLLGKLARLAGGGVSGAFSPVYQALAASVERLAQLHHRTQRKIQDLVKDVSRYADDLHKKHKQVKESEAGGLEAALALQQARLANAKADDAHQAKLGDVERLRKEGASQKELDRQDAKLRKLAEERRSAADRHANAQRDFSARMGVACRRFQDLEEAHLAQMKRFVAAYLDLVQNNHDLVAQVHQDFKRTHLDLTVDRLLEAFVSDKCEALERAKNGDAQPHQPKEPTFAQRTSRRTTSLLNLFTPAFQSRDDPQPDSAPCSAPSSPGADRPEPDSAQPNANPLRESRWFLRSKRAKPKPKKPDKKSSAPPAEGSDLEEKEEEPPDATRAPPPPAPDDDAEPPAQVDDEGYSVRPADVKGAYSSTDSESEDERERERERKIRVEIKPLSNGDAAASVDELRATAEALSLFPRRGSNLFRSPTPPANPYQALDSPTATPTSAVPRPPSRRSEPGDFRTAVAVAASRGPSPLTIGMADTVPLAVAFHEIVHGYFKGADEAKCQVKMSGDMMLSFPTGIIGALANNPNPAKLRFRLKNASQLENVVPNRRLVSASSPSAAEPTVEFDMSALTALLRHQAEKNPHAAYFNVDILKYQIKPRPGAGSCPFQLVAYWKREPSHTDLKIDYKYNAHAMSSPSPLLNLSISAPMCGAAVRDITSRPECESTEGGDLLWKFTELSQHSDGGGVGSLRAHVEVDDGPSDKSTISALFNCEGATLSGVEFELTGPGYRVSLVKRRFVSGKYICDGE